MTATATPGAIEAPRQPAGPGTSGHWTHHAGRALRSEWTKIRTVRSTAWSLLATGVLTVALGAIVCAAQASNWSHSNPIDRITFDPTSTSQVGLIFGQLAIGVLGVLVMTSEYSTGMIRATFAAIPHRPRVLAAKAAVFGLLALVVGEISTFGAFFAGQAILAGSAPHASLGQANVLRAVIGGGLYLTVLGLMALGIGALIRHSAGAISTFVAVVLILPLLAQALPSSLSHNIIRFLPDAIGQSMSSTIATGRIERFHAFSPWVGFAILCGYAIVLLGLGAWSLTRRDA